VLNFPTPALRELFFDCTAPLDDRYDVGVVVYLHQGKTLAVIEFTVEVESFDLEVEVVEETYQQGLHWGYRRLSDGEPPMYSVCFKLVRTMSRRHEMQWFQLLPHCSRARQSRLCRHSRAVGGDRQQSPPAREGHRVCTLAKVRSLQF